MLIINYPHFYHIVGIKFQFISLLEYGDDANDRDRDRDHGHDDAHDHDRGHGLNEKKQQKREQKVLIFFLSLICCMSNNICFYLPVFITYNIENIRTWFGILIFALLI